MENQLNDFDFINYLRDKEQIIELHNTYAMALDTRDWSRLNPLFTDDVSSNYGGIESHGRDELLAMIKSFLGGCGPSQHLFSNHRITVSGNKAISAFYGRVMHAGIGEQKNVLFDFWGEYQDELIRTEQGWRICKRLQVPFHATGDASILKAE